MKIESRSSATTTTITGTTASVSPSVVRQTSKKSRRGFTTLEALISTAVLGVLVAGLYGGITFGTAVIQVTREKLRGSQVLQEKLETIRLYKWQQITNHTYMPTNFTAALNPTNNTPFYEGWFVIKRAPLGTEAYNSDMLQVDVNIRWKSLGALKTLNLQTFVSRHGIQNYAY